MPWLRELKRMRETESGWDGAIFETRFYRISAKRFDRLMEYGTLAAVHPFDYTQHIISVSAEVDPDTGWNGWNWMNDEFDSAGLNP